MRLGSVALKYATRSLTRHSRRTILSMVGTGIGCAMALVALSWMDGAIRMQVRAIAESGAGHIRMVHRNWPETQEDTLRLQGLEEVLATVAETPHLEHYSVRAHAKGLLAFGTRTAPAAITGVLPKHEMAANRILRRGALEGRYLEEDEEGAVVIGRTLARRLDVMLDDALYATLSGKDDIHSAMLRIVGILDTGSQELDLAVCHITLADMQEITGIPGAGEISLVLSEERHSAEAKAHLTETMPADNTVITWREVNPSLAANVDSDTAFMRLMALIVIVVVALGIMSAQLTAVLERRAEFAMLSALGMKTRQIVSMVMMEAVVIGLGGAVVALGVGGSVSYYLATRGMDLSRWLDDDLGFADVLFDPYLYGSFGVWLIGYALAIALATTIFATLYPAWKAAQVMPADALRTTG